ncbi:MAG: hypothetical protein WCJ70_02595 [bacterium]
MTFAEPHTPHHHPRHSASCPSVRDQLMSGAKLSAFLTIAIMAIGMMLGLMSPASRSPLFGWTLPRVMQTAEAPSDLRLVGAEATRVITITAKGDKFSPELIPVMTGELVTFDLISEDHEYSLFIPEIGLHLPFSKDTPGRSDARFKKVGDYVFASTVYAPRYEQTKGIIRVTQATN